MTTSDGIVELLEAGANVTVPAGKPTEKLIEFARIAKRKGVRLTITGAHGKATEKLLQIIEAGRGFVDIIL